MNHYTTLGISKNASESDIKAAYRKLAMKYHPDRNKGNKDAEKKMSEVNAAYEILGNAEKKATYDRTQNVENGGSYHYKNTNFDDMDDFEEILRRGFEHSDYSSWGKYEKSSSTKYAEVTLGFWEAIFGCEKQFEIKMNNQIRKFNVQFPAGLNEGETITVAIENDKLQIEISISPDKKFQRQNLDLFTEIKVPLEKAILGGTIKISHWDKDLEVTIPENLRQNQMLRLSNAGIKRKLFSGDLYLKCNIEMPTKLTKKQKEWIEKAFKNDKPNVETSQFEDYKHIWQRLKK